MIQDKVVSSSDKTLHCPWSKRGLIPLTTAKYASVCPIATNDDKANWNENAGSTPVWRSRIRPRGRESMRSPAKRDNTGEIPVADSDTEG